MAEERLIDEDKDKKYKIRKNADGEDELYIDETPEEEPEEELTVLFDEEEVMTPEQIAERDRLLAEEQERLELKLSTFLDRATDLIAEGDYAGAETSLVYAEELSPTSGRVYVLKCRVLSKDFSDFSRLDEINKAALKVEIFAKPNEKQEVISKLGLVQENANSFKEEMDELNERNEEQKAERRVIFKADRKRAIIRFGIVSAVMVVFIVLMSYFLSVRNASLDGTYMYLAIAFSVAAGLSVLVELFFVKGVWATARKCKLNERNSATKLGRAYEEAKSGYEAYTSIYEAFTVDKESK